MHMNKAEAFTKLGEITQEKQELTEKLTAVLAQEKELYAFLQLPHPSDHEKPPRRKRITKEKTIEIRRMVVNVMRDLAGKGLTWLPMQLIVKRVNQEMPNAEETEIETQLRYLAKSESAPVEHNQQRGNGSAYTYTGTKPVPKPTPQQ
jgi:hypothetical protein